MKCECAYCFVWYLLVGKVDYFIRHKEDFHAVAFYYSVKLLEKQLPPPEKLKVKDLREFLKKRADVRLLKNGTAFKLLHLTPFREPNVQVFGKFQCVNVVCRSRWESLCTYADHYQICAKCGQRVYPFEQRPLAQSEFVAYQQDPVDENFIDYEEVAYVGRRDSFLNVISPARAAKLSSCSSSVNASGGFYLPQERGLQIVSVASGSAGDSFNDESSSDGERIVSTGPSATAIRGLSAGGSGAARDLLNSSGDDDRVV